MQIVLAPFTDFKISTVLAQVQQREDVYPDPILVPIRDIEGNAPFPVRYTPWFRVKNSDKFVSMDGDGMMMTSDPFSYSNYAISR